MLGKRPLWLQTSTHEVPLPSSNNPAPLLSLFTLCFFHDALYAACLLSILAVSTQNIVKGKNLRASLYPQKDPTYLYPLKPNVLLAPYPYPTCSVSWENAQMTSTQFAFWPWLGPEGTLAGVQSSRRVRSQHLFSRTAPCGHLGLAHVSTEGQELLVSPLLSCPAG